MKCVSCPRKCSKCIFAVLFLSFGFCILKKLRNCTVIYAGKDVLSDLPAVRIYGIKDGARTLDTVKNVFIRLGYRIEVNHFPGSGIITQKKNLVSLHLPETPKSFLMPSQKEIFLQYAKSHANKFWMMKSSNHRGIRILNGSEELNMAKTFVQEYIHKPLLISGRKFDIGVYVMLTSIDPLRVYVYYDEVLLRFCTKKYLPFNINLVESYVIGDDYMPVWEVPDLKPYYVELNYTAKESLNAYLHAKGKSGDRLWSQIFKIVQNVYFASEAKILETAMFFGSIRNFFELVRFDFVADELLTVYLLEVNMSPNLSPAHFAQNSLLYEQVTFSSLQLVGLVRKIHSEFCSW